MSEGNLYMCAFCGTVYRWDIGHDKSECEQILLEREAYWQRQLDEVHHALRRYYGSVNQQVISIQEAKANDQ